MSDTAAAKTPSAPLSGLKNDAGADLRMLAQVERWMAAIRELNREQPTFSAVN